MLKLPRPLAVLVAAITIAALTLGAAPISALASCGDDCPCEAADAAPPAATVVEDDECCDHDAPETADDPSPAPHAGDAPHRRPCPPDCDRCHGSSATLQRDPPTPRSYLPRAAAKLDATCGEAPRDGVHTRPFRPPRRHAAESLSS